MSDFPDAWYLILSSRLVPDIDGGYTVAALARARFMTDAGAPALLLTVDPAPAETHAAHGAEFARRGMVDPARLRNLFDEAIAEGGGAAEWLLAAAHPGVADPALEYRDAASGTVALPVIANDPDWHISTAPIVVRDADGETAGVVDGFGALYRAWLEHVVASLRAEIARPVVVIIESRQLGELLVDWDDPDVRLAHAIHTTHLEPPYTPDAPLNTLWSRWFAVADRFDTILWPTPAQRADVRARFGGAGEHVVAPHGIELPASIAPFEARVPGRIVMLCRLAPPKRVHLAIRAFAGVVSAQPHARLEIFGDGSEREDLEALVDELGLREVVTFHGRTDEPAAALATAQVYLSTAVHEGQGLALAEAIATGTPAVLFDVRYGPRDTLAHGGGMLVLDGDLEALTATLVEVLSDDALRRRLADEAVAASRALLPARAMEALAAAMTAALARPARRR